MDTSNENNVTSQEGISTSASIASEPQSAQFKPEASIPETDPMSPLSAPNDNNETITITKGELRDIAREIRDEVKADTAKEIAEIRSQQSMLLDIADTKQLQNYMNRHRKSTGTLVRLSTYQDKVVVSWQVVEDMVQQDINTGRWREKQVMRVVFEDDSDISVDYNTFTDIVRRTQVVAKVLEKTQVDTDDPDIKKFRFKVRREDNGKEYSIMDTFVN